MNCEPTIWPSTAPISTASPWTSAGTTGGICPTDGRLAAVRKGETDPDLDALYFQYGRYLLMGSSRRPGVLPANLQGIWNDKMWAPWEADYHLNINLQMNYWPVDLCNLSETIDPLVDWLARLSEKGTVSAKRLYGAKGWLCYLSTNPFGRTNARRFDEAVAIHEQRARPAGWNVDGDGPVAAL